MKRILYVLAIIALIGCEQYRGIVSPGNIDKYVQTGSLVCLEDGETVLCIKQVAVPGPQGEPGRDGVSIVGPAGPQGEQGIQGEPGIDGIDGQDGKDGEDGAVIMVVTPYIRLETSTEVFVMEISQGIPEDEPDVYVTPVAAVQVPVGGGETTITPSRSDDSVSVSPTTTPLPDNGEIWHVMYRTEDGQAHVYVYPRERDIQTVPPFEISEMFKIELQGTRAAVNYLLQIKLAEDSVSLGTIGGVQGVIDR